MKAPVSSDYTVIITYPANFCSPYSWFPICSTTHELLTHWGWVTVKLCLTKPYHHWFWWWLDAYSVQIHSEQILIYSQPGSCKQKLTSFWSKLLQKMHLKMPPVKWRLFCISFNVLSRFYINIGLHLKAIRQLLYPWPANLLMEDRIGMIIQATDKVPFGTGSLNSVWNRPYRANTTAV